MTTFRSTHSSLETSNSSLWNKSTIFALWETLTISSNSIHFCSNRDFKLLPVIQSFSFEIFGMLLTENSPCIIACNQVIRFKQIETDYKTKITNTWNHKRWNTKGVNVIFFLLCLDFLKIEFSTMSLCWIKHSSNVKPTSWVNRLIVAGFGQYLLYSWVVVRQCNYSLINWLIRKLTIDSINSVFWIRIII